MLLYYSGMPNLYAYSREITEPEVVSLIPLDAPQKPATASITADPYASTTLALIYDILITAAKRQESQDE